MVFTPLQASKETDTERTIKIETNFTNLTIINIPPHYNERRLRQQAMLTMVVMTATATISHTHQGRPYHCGVVRGLDADVGAGSGSGVDSGAIYFTEDICCFLGR